MVVTVKFVGALRGISGKERLTIKIEGETSLRELVKKIVKQQPKLKRVLIDPELQDPRPNALILVNGKEISVLKGLETVVREGDEVVFVPVIHGG
ncbi:MAG: MoaD/ThiS family protein [Candidatus Bathyarchaeia archaeon]